MFIFVLLFGLYLLVNKLYNIFDKLAISYMKFMYEFICITAFLCYTTLIERNNIIIVILSYIITMIIGTIFMIFILKERRNEDEIETEPRTAECCRRMCKLVLQFIGASISDKWCCRYWKNDCITCDHRTTWNPYK